MLSISRLKLILLLLLSGTGMCAPLTLLPSPCLKIEPIKETRRAKRMRRNALTKEKLHILTFSKDENSDLKKYDSIDAACKYIQKGKIHRLDNTQIDTLESSLKMSCDIPIGYKKTIFIYVSGFAGNFSFNKYPFPSNSAHAAYGLFNNGVISSAPCISFCAKKSHKRTTFNFGQTTDQNALDIIYQETIAKNPEAKIVFFGICVGATTILNYLANPDHAPDKFNNVEAIILECPGISFDEVIKSIEQNYMPRLLKKITTLLLKAWFPSYNSHKPTILETYANIPEHIKMLIAYVQHDKVTSSQGAKKIIKVLSEQHKHLYAYEITDKKIKHGRLSAYQNYRHYMHAFLNEYELDDSPVHNDIDLQTIKVG